MDLYKQYAKKGKSSYKYSCGICRFFVSFQPKNLHEHISLHHLSIDIYSVFYLVEHRSDVVGATDVFSFFLTTKVLSLWMKVSAAILWRVWRKKCVSKAGQEYQEFRQVQRTAKKMLWRILISKLLILVECLKFPKLQRGNWISSYGVLIYPH